MTCVNATFAPSPKSRLEPSGMDPVTMMHSPAMVEHGIAPQHMDIMIHELIIYHDVHVLLKSFLGYLQYVM